MKKILLGLICVLVGACSSGPEISEDQPISENAASESTQTPQADARRSVLKGIHEEQGRQMEKQLAAISEDQPEKLLLHYVRYVTYGDEDEGMTFAMKMRDEAFGREQRLEGLDIYEGAYSLCVFRENLCAQTIGDWTRKNFVPLLRKGDPLALEIYVIHRVVADLEGPAYDALQELNRDPKIQKHKQEIQRIEKKHAALIKMMKTTQF